MAAVLLLLHAAFVVIAAVFVTQTRAQGCPALCSNRCLGNMVDCSKQSLSEVPNDLPSWVTILELKSNMIRTLPDAAFRHLDQLEKLDLGNNQLSTINGTFFLRLPALKQLKLAHNNLSSVPRPLWKTNTSTLILHHNKIHTLKAEHLENYPFLRHLDLNFNRIVELTSGSFPNLPNLHNLSGRKRITCKFEKELDAILGSRPTTQPSMVVDTGTNSEEDDGGEEDEEESTLEESINTDDGNIEENTQEEEEDNDGQGRATPTLPPTPVQKAPSVRRRPKVSSAKGSIADAITLLADAQVKSDQMYIQLEERRMDLDMKMEERRERMRMEFEEKRYRDKQEFELKRMEMMMMMNRSQFQNIPPSNVAQPGPSNTSFNYPQFNMPNRYDPANTQTQADNFSMGESVRMSLDTNHL